MSFGCPPRGPRSSQEDWGVTWWRGRAEGAGLQLGHHWGEGTRPLRACSSVGPGRPPVNFLRQREARMEEEQHQRACTDSDHHSARIPLQGKKKKKTRFQLFQFFFPSKFKCTFKLTLFLLSS